MWSVAFVILVSFYFITGLQQEHIEEGGEGSSEELILAYNDSISRRYKSKIND